MRPEHRTKTVGLDARRRRVLLCSILAGTVLAGGPVLAEDSLEPYKIVRSLQFIQDSIVHGDHASNDMQRFLLKTLDDRLRSLQPGAFQDTRNIDAVYIFAMSGGNPATLDYLASRDVSGDFDGRLTRVLHRYLQGQGVTTLSGLDDLVKEYADSEVGPYVGLVAGNIASAMDPAKALDYFDQVRLTAPGTNLEEAALRRSLAITEKQPDYPRAMNLATDYVRRFLYSPYASQFADMFVDLVVDGDHKIDRAQWMDVVGLMDDERARELFLRVSRRALLAGNEDLARQAAVEADKRLPKDGLTEKGLAQLYGSLADISTGKVLEAQKALTAIPDSELSERDRNLRDAAANIARQITMPPQPSATAPATGQALAKGSPAVVPGSSSAGMDIAGSTQSSLARTAENGAAGQAGTHTAPPDGGSSSTAAQPVSASPTDAASAAEDASMQTYMQESRMKLQQIDELLGKEKKK